MFPAMMLASPLAVAWLLILVAIPVSVAVSLFRQARSKTAVICPPAEMPSEVEVGPDMQLRKCTRLAEGDECDQHCLTQVHYAPMDLGAFVERHAESNCTVCEKKITADDWYSSRLRGVSASAAPAASTRTIDSPICWDCFALSRASG